MKSDPGNGATFWFTVDVALPDPGQIPDALNERGEGPPPEKIYLIFVNTDEEVLQQVPEERIAGVLNKPIVESGADVFLNKPVDRDELYRAILEVID